MFELVFFVFGLSGYIFPLSPMSTWGLASIAVGFGAFGFLLLVKRSDRTVEDPSLSTEIVRGRS